MECIICFEEKEQINLPCKHTLCVDCAKLVDLCPLCRVPVRNVHLVEIVEVVDSHDLAELNLVELSELINGRRQAPNEGLLWCCLLLFCCSSCFIGAFFVIESHL